MWKNFKFHSAQKTPLQINSPYLNITVLLQWAYNFKKLYGPFFMDGVQLPQG